MSKLLVILFAVCGVANAADMGDTARIEHCQQFANVYTQAANARDGGESPQFALKVVKQFALVPLPVKKFIINDVYFKRPGIKGPGISNAAFGICMQQLSPASKFQPLD